MKKCAKCHIEQEELQFVLDRGRIDGLGIYCKYCRKAIYNKKHPSARTRFCPHRRNLPPVMLNSSQFSSVFDYAERFADIVEPPSQET